MRVFVTLFALTGLIAPLNAYAQDVSVRDQLWVPAVKFGPAVKYCQLPGRIALAAPSSNPARFPPGFQLQWFSNTWAPGNLPCLSEAALKDQFGSTLSTQQIIDRDAVLKARIDDVELKVLQTLKDITVDDTVKAALFQIEQRLAAVEQLAEIIKSLEGTLRQLEAKLSAQNTEPRK